MLLSFWLDKRPGESHLALDGFFFFVRAALVRIKPNGSQNVTKMGPPHSPIFGPMGAISVAVLKQASMELGAKIGSPKNQIETQNWCQFLSPSFDTICLPRDAISKYITNGRFIMDNPTKMDDLGNLGVPLF